MQNYNIVVNGWAGANKITGPCTNILCSALTLTLLSCSCMQLDVSVCLSLSVSALPLVSQELSSQRDKNNHLDHS